MKIKFFFFFSLLLLPFVQLRAQGDDSIKVSLLTCSPGQEVYSLYGHTALRVEKPSCGLDVVFNYGVFSFDQPYFVWHFVLGECDYMVIPLLWEDFVPEYERRGSSITAQVLNLNHDEAQLILDKLIDNCAPENRVYRYNFLYNNCTTKARDMIESCVEGKVVYSDTLQHCTYRQILHEYASVQPWMQEGNDLLLGCDVDTILTARAAMFAPEYMMQYAETAVIRAPNNDTRPLVARTETLLQKREVPVRPVFPLSPILSSLCFLAFCFLIVGVERLLNRMIWLWDVLLLSVQGLSGGLLLFMFFFSEHPGVGSNWLICLLHPFSLFAIPSVVKSAFRRRKTLWHAINFTFLAIFITFSSWMPQDFGNIVVPLALALMTRPISYYLYYQRNRL